MGRICCVAVLSWAPVFAQSGDDEQEVRRVELAWMECYLSHDAAALDKYEADEFRIVYPDGTVVTKAQELAAVKKPHKPRDQEFKISTENVTVRVYGNTAVAAGDFVQAGVYREGAKTGQRFRLVERYTDVYVKRDGRWQVVAAQLTAVP